MEALNEDQLDSKAQKLTKFLNQQEDTRNLIRDLFRCGEVSKRDYDEYTDHQQEAFKVFLANLTKKDDGQQTNVVGTAVPEQGESVSPGSEKEV